MSNSIYKFTRQIAVILSSLVSLSLIIEGNIIKSLMNLILMGLFVYTSKLYQKKFNIISVSYLFIFINIYLVYSLASCYYDLEKIIELDPTGFQGWNTMDQYPIYFLGILLSYCFILFYLEFICKKAYVNVVQISVSQKEVKNLYIGMFIVSIAYFLSGKNSIIIVPILAIMLILLLIDESHRLRNIIILCICIIIFHDILTSRYHVIQIVIPMIMAYLIKNKRNDSKYSIYKLYVLLFFGLVMVMTYGVVSEVYKLNALNNSSYDLKEIVSSSRDIIYFVSRQFYRLFIVWIKNGGYIIYHTQKNGFFYGLTYIKPLANLLGFEYISLPEIAATYNYSSYSQPGMLAEGYANFGIFGIVLNICLMFFIMEYIKKMFVKRPSLVSLIYMAIPFTKVLFDGGTINSVIAIVAVLIVINSLNSIRHIKK